MNIEVICPVCGDMFKTATTERDLNNYEKRVTCTGCWKSFFLHRAAWRIAKKIVVEAVVLAGQKVDSTSPKKKRSKWSKKAHSEMTKRIIGRKK